MYGYYKSIHTTSMHFNYEESTHHYYFIQQDIE